MAAKVFSDPEFSIFFRKTVLNRLVPEFIWGNMNAAEFICGVHAEYSVTQPFAQAIRQRTSWEYE